MPLAILAERFGGIDIWNYVGYAASVIVFLSFVMTSVVKLRITSTVGSALFSLYGFMIGSIPTGVLNFGVVCANIYYLVRMKRQKDLFTAHTIDIRNDFLQDFLLFNGRDIQKCFGGYNADHKDADLAILTYCNMTAAGLLLGKDLGGGTLRIDLDYATAEYRDCRLGRFLYPKLAQMGFHHLVATTNSECEAQVRYLRSMGFTEQNGCFVRDV